MFINRNFSNIVTLIEIFENFDLKRDFSKIFNQIEIVLNFFTEIEMFRKFWLKARFFENFESHRYFSIFEN